MDATCFWLILTIRWERCTSTTVFSRTQWNSLRCSFKNLTNFFLSNREFYYYTWALSPWCSEQLSTDSQDHITQPFIFFPTNNHDDQGGGGEWKVGVCERLVPFFFKWPRVSFLLSRSSHHLKDLPNKSIMVNEHWGEWQGMQPSVRNSAADVLDKHTCQGTSCISLPIMQSQDRFSLPKAMRMHIVTELPLSSFRIMQIKVKLINSINFAFCFHTLSCQSCTWKKGIHSSAALPNYSYYLQLG